MELWHCKFGHIWGQANVGGIVFYKHQLQFILYCTFYMNIYILSVLLKRPIMQVNHLNLMYSNVPKFSGIQVSANSVDSDQIRVYTVYHSVCIFWMHYSIVQPRCSIFMVIRVIFSGVRSFRIFTVVYTSLITLTHTIWATSWENLFMPYANNKDADQYNIFSFYIQNVKTLASFWKRADQFEPIWVLPSQKPPKTGFLMTLAHIISN